MRLRLAVRFVAAALTALTAACAGESSTALPDQSPANTTSGPAGDSSAVCQGVYTFAMAKADDLDPTVAAFDKVWLHPEKYPPDRRIAIRSAYFTQQEEAARALVAEAIDPQLHAALQTYADGWAKLAAVRTAAGPGSSQPNWQPVMDLCPGVLDRIFTDLDALGK